MALQSAAPTPRRSVMIVEDEGILRSLLSMAMVDEGYEVTSAVDGQDALEQLQVRLPKVIVMDLQMPRMNGWQLLSALRAEPRTRNITIIVVSAQLAQSTADQLEVRACLLKPFNLDALFALLDDVFRDLATTAALECP